VAALWVPLFLLLQLLMGLGMLDRLRVTRPGAQRLALGMLAGLPVSSLVVFALDLVGIRLTAVSIALGFLLAAAALNLARPRRPARPALRLAPCEWPFVLFLAGVIAISAWRAFYLPVTLRDAIVGLDLVAKYAAQQGTLASSVFHDPQLQGQLSNQPFYAPFPMLMQVVYRLAGLPFGQLWLSALFIAFVVFVYSRLKQSVHPIVAGVILFLLVAVPEMYAHTFMVLNDFPCAVFFGVGMILLHDGAGNGRRADFLLGALFLGFACWARAETLLFVVPGALLAARRAWRPALALAGIAGAFVLLWHGLYLGLVLRQGPAGAGVSVPLDALALAGSFYRAAWLFGQTGSYGYLPYVFFAAVIVNRLILRDRAAGDLLAWTAILYVGFALILFAVPAASLEGTLKRGYFKFFPIMAFYLAETRAARIVSRRIERWAGQTKAAAPS
jgi:hypothetical protein